MAISEEVDRIVLYRLLPLYFHGYVLPFVGFYLILAYFWFVVYGLFSIFEIGCICLASIGVIQVLTCLFCHWSIYIRCLLTCIKATDIKSATSALVTPVENNGVTTLVKIFHDQDPDGKDITWLKYQKLEYIYDYEEKKQFQPVDFPLDYPFKYYQDWKGYLEEDQVTIAKRKYGQNKIEMNVPEFMELFLERATAPFFVFQVFCVALWCLDEYWYYSIFTLFMLITFEATLVQQQMRNMKEIRNMGSSAFMLQVYRFRKWRSISSEELLPGDICSIVRSKNDIVVPCDMLILRGSCIVDESMLTGESVPQMKESIEALNGDDVFTIENDAKLHSLSGGTKVVNHTPPEKTSGGIKAPDNGCVVYVLRTGFGTSQGKLLKTILYGVKRVTANNLETFLFILFLLFFAIAASSYVWIKGTEDPRRNRYKLFLECTLILTSVVPPELPIELSLAVNSSLLALSKLGVFCTEPFRIPFAGKVDVCCFDKTGTLTSDDLVVEGVAGLDGTTKITPIGDAPIETLKVIATSHSLTYIDENLVGDPLEKASLKAIGWNLSKGDICMPKKGMRQSLKILQRFHFSSALKRMSSIVSRQGVDSTATTFHVTAKGAPETLKSMIINVPSSYDDVHKKLSREGGRVLALAYKELNDYSLKDLRETTREDAESGLTFAGFIVISCPLKVDSKDVISQIQHSSHHVVMITGDNPLTGCHVARELQLSKKTILLLVKCSLDYANDDCWQWQTIDESVQFPLIPPNGIQNLTKDFEFCLTGESLSVLMGRADLKSLFRTVLIHTKVFARVNPKQKEQVVNQLKRMGHVVLMCGDGTNDVGALKHSHVGVALLPGSRENPEDHKKKQKSKSKENADEKGKKDSINPPMKATSSKAARSRAVARGDADVPALKNVNDHQKRLKEMMKELEEADNAHIVKLGDASIASPFTSRYHSINCIAHVIRQGRCTLVTTLQMFKILALNALILAYSQSALYLEGVKFSDGQATLQGILLAGCFLFISRSKPLNKLSKIRPLPNIFNFYTIATVLLQFACHLAAMYSLVQEVYRLTPKKEEYVDLERKFEPSLLNSTVYIISVGMQIITFAVNYKGHPFMESILENRPLLYSLFLSTGGLVCLSTGIVPDFSAHFEIVDFPIQFRIFLVQVLLLDYVSSYVIDRCLSYICGYGALKMK